MKRQDSHTLAAFIGNHESTLLEFFAVVI